MVDPNAIRIVCGSRHIPVELCPRREVLLIGVPAANMVQNMLLVLLLPPVFCPCAVSAYRGPTKT